jgi:small subunit ribosomal protein S19e
MGIYDIYPNDLIEKAAEELKKNEAIKAPVWATFAKTGVHKERAPADPDWWYARVAAVLRAVCTLGPIGVQKLRTKYGGKKNRGHQPSIFRKGSGSVIRKALQQLDKAGFTKFEEKGVHKGRIITKEGKLFLKKVADSIKPKVKKEAKPVEEVKKAPKKEIKIIEKKEVPKKEEKLPIKEPEKEIAEIPKKEIQEVPKKEEKEEVKTEEKKPEEQKKLEEK